MFLIIFQKIPNKLSDETTSTIPNKELNQKCLIPEPVLKATKSQHKVSPKKNAENSKKLEKAAVQLEEVSVEPITNKSLTHLTKEAQPDSLAIQSSTKVPKRTSTEPLAIKSPTKEVKEAQPEQSIARQTSTTHKTTTEVNTKTDITEDSKPFVNGSSSTISIIPMLKNEKISLKRTKANKTAQNEVDSTLDSMDELPPKIIKRSGSRSRKSSESDVPQYTDETDHLIKDIAQTHRRALVGLKSIDRLRFVLNESWTGVFALKKQQYPSRFYMLAGSQSLAEAALPLRKESIETTLAQQPPQKMDAADNFLRISQRLRLDQLKIREIEK